MTKSTRNYWLWITTPEFYENADGSDGLRAGDRGDWWTCTKGTRRGDLALLWRTTPKSDLGYLMRAESDAFPLHKDRYARTRGWRFGCEYQVIYRFRHPLSYRELSADPWLAKEWGVVRRGGLQGVAKSIPSRVWSHLQTLLRSHEGQALARALRRAKASLPRLHREQDIETRLMTHPSKLHCIAPRLALWKADARIGRQLECEGSGGRIDLLFTTPGERTFVVVELKVVRADHTTFGQVCSYMGWVHRHIAQGRRVIGVVVALSADARFDDCLRTNRDVHFLSLADLGLEL